MPTGFTSLELSKLFLSCTLINAGGFHFRGTGTGTDTDLDNTKTYFSISNPLQLHIFIIQIASKLFAGSSFYLEIVETMDGFEMSDFISGSFAMGLFIACETFGTSGLGNFSLASIVYGLESCRLSS